MTSRELDDPDDHPEPESHHAPGAGELRSILRQILAGQHATTRHLHRIEKQMASLQQSLDDLTTAVNTAVADLGGGVQALKDQLAQAQVDLAALQAVDADNVAARDDALAKLAQSQADAQTAADNVEAQVSVLNAATGAAQPPVAPPSV